MGARVYNPVVGRFTSCDPVTGGNENAYNYPDDPVNGSDADGDFNWLHALDVASAALGVASFVCEICGIASSAISVGTGIYRLSRGDKSGWSDLASAATFGVAKGLETGVRAYRSAKLAQLPKYVRGRKAPNAAARRKVKATPTNSPNNSSARRTR